jgi:hypothetical protein
MNIKEALDYLDGSGHQFLSVEIVLTITNAFGFEGTTRVVRVGEDRLAFLWDKEGTKSVKPRGKMRRGGGRNLSASWC